MGKTISVEKLVNEVERKIHFFTYNLSRGIGTSRVKVDITEILKEVNKLNYTDSGRYLVYPNSKDLAIFKFFEKEGAIYGQIAFIRRSARPAMERKGTGEVKPIENLIDGDGLVELTHFVFYKEDQILAIEYNHFGPRANALGYYFTHKIPVTVHNADFAFITDKNFQNKLARIDTESIKSATFKIAVDKISEVQSIDTSLFNAMDAAKNFGPEEIALTLSSAKRSKNRFSLESLLGRVGNFIQGKDGETNEIFSDLFVNAKEKNSPNFAIFDLLEEHLVSKITAIKLNKNNIIVSEDIFDKIDAAFIEKRSLLLPYVGKVE